MYHGQNERGNGTSEGMNPAGGACLAQETIVVGMSGGVDSAVAAMLLRDQGLRVLGVFMKNWEEDEEGGACTATADYEDVRRVCDALGMPYYTVNFARQYWDRVFEHFLSEYKAGRTPNPDVVCNREIKFKELLDVARKMGDGRLATGHYARVEHREGRYALLKGQDGNKDQSYFLYMLTQPQLSRAVFPLGELRKEQVRDLAAQANLVVAEKKDSTGICFIGERRFKEFLQRYLPAQPGPMRTLDGVEIGRHDGLMYYTPGQRRGLGIGGGGNGERWFVVRKDLQTNTLYVSQGEPPELFADHCNLTELTFCAGQAPGTAFDCGAKVRYRQSDQQARVTLTDDGGATVEFAQPQRALAAGQSVVLYDGDECLGGGILL